jgi:transglutaminase-like putative cysteine protease
MAGPEWAVSSALIIISLSVLGAPVLRSGVSSVAGDGIVRLVPNLPSTTPAPSSGTNFSGSAELNVGNGPAGLLGIEVLRVKTKNPKYLLSEVYDSYRAGWAKSIRTRRSVVEEVTVGGWSRTNYLPRMKGRLTAFEIRYVAGQHDRLYFPGEILTLNSEIRGLGFDRVGTIVASNLIPVGTQFSGTTRVINVAVPPNASGRVLPPTQGTYTDVEFVPPSVSKLAASVTASATTDVERAQLIYEELGRRCRYNLQAPAVPRGKDPVEHFLFTEKQGYCDLFASAMATMARSTGLVSRVCVGFLVRSRVPDRAGFYPVNDDDYHMWAEVYFDGVGWVPFDPTEIAENVSPNETNKSVDWSRIGQIIGVVVAALAGVGILAKIAYDSRGGMRMVTRNSETQKQYLVVQQAIERATGKPRRLNETSSEYLGRVGEQIPDLVPPAKLLLDRLEAELFSRDAADERLAADVKEFRKKSRQRP